MLSNQIKFASFQIERALLSHMIYLFKHIKKLNIKISDYTQAISKNTTNKHIRHNYY